MAGSNTRRPAWAADPLVDILTKTDAVDLAWALARRLDSNSADGATAEAIVGIMAEEAECLAATDKPMARAAKKLRDLHKQLREGHAERCIRRKALNVGAPVSDIYLRAGWRVGPGGAWVCAPECKAGASA